MSKNNTEYNIVRQSDCRTVRLSVWSGGKTFEETNMTKQDSRVIIRRMLRSTRWRMSAMFFFVCGKSYLCSAGVKSHLYPNKKRFSLTALAIYLCTMSCMP